MKKNKKKENHLKLILLIFLFNQFELYKSKIHYTEFINIYDFKNFFFIILFQINLLNILNIKTINNMYYNYKNIFY